MSSGGMGVVVLVVKMVASRKFGFGFEEFVYGCGRRVGLLVLRKLFCDGYVSVKRYDGLHWAVMNVLGLGGE